MSGLGIPTYVIDSPHGGGKIPLMPNYLVSASDDSVVLRNYEGMLVRYQAEDKPATIKETATRGVSALLQGSKSMLMPEKNERIARRRRRLRVLEQEPGPVSSGSCCGGGSSESESELVPLHTGQLVPE
jgi:lysine 2,3-aminomutase